MKIQVVWTEHVTYKHEFEVDDDFFTIDPPLPADSEYTAFEVYEAAAEELIMNMSPEEWATSFDFCEDREIFSVDEVTG